ncbi:unnamed protein product [Sphenostylis stenocarpa]|uniref:Secreted protein n=1 Tax=Sphenostylis stenocarpa TaxID=92480 RepID=A0AA86RYD8_9FABA|nr:unnamed protein product [Sphenostylis stenocarpa]
MQHLLLAMTSFHNFVTQMLAVLAVGSEVEMKVIRGNECRVKETLIWDSVKHFNHLKWTEQPKTFRFAKALINE